VCFRKYLEVLLMVLLVWLVDLSEVLKLGTLRIKASIQLKYSSIYLNRSVLRWDSLVVLRVEDHEQLHLEVLMGDL